MAMNSSTHLPDSPPQQLPTGRSVENDDDSVVHRVDGEAPDQVELLADDIAGSILRALQDGPKRGRELIAECDAARSTVYRRLSRLEAANLVASEIHLDPDGHHCRSFQIVRNAVRVTVDEGALRVTLESA